jgi:intein/homing endonuclease
MYFTNTKYFKEAGDYFLRNGVYTPAIPDTLEHTNFWEEELRRCKEGYSVAGTKITGDHYFYLNYCLINKVNFEGDTVYTTKVISLPDFWDGDYEFFWVREIAKSGIELEDYKKLGLHSKISHLAGGKHLICGKSRRKGFSFKNAALATKEYLLNKSSQTLICAFEEKYVKDTMSKVVEYTNHLNSITNPSPFAKNKLIDTKLHLRSGYKIKSNGINVDKGDKSEILGVTFKDNPDASRGKDPKLVIFEEAGTFANIEDSFYALEPSLKAGSYVTGQCIIFGTGGGMDSGSTLQFNKMFYNPDAYNMLAFENIYDEGYSDKPCGFFWPVYLNKEGFVDKQGNSDIQGAIDDEIAIRAERAKTAKDSNQLTKYITEQPFNPQEAFSVANSNIFNVFDLTLQLKTLEHSPTVDNIGIKGHMTITETGKADFVKDDSLYECGYPVTDHEKHAGAVVIYEFPPEGEIPSSLYIAGLDPYAKDQSVYSNSLGACYIYKRSSINGGTGDRIVASYIGRPDTLKQFHETVRRLLLYYNAKCLYENQINSFKEFLENKNCLYLLAETPSCLKATKNSVRKGYGQTMSKDVKLELETYLAEWLLEPNSEGIPNYKFIYDKALLKELISYNDKGNFDRCFIPDTKVLLNEGYKNIQDIKVDDLVYTHKNRLQPVQELLKSEYNDKVYKFSISGQNEMLECTKNHPVYTTNTFTKRSGKRTKDRYRLNSPVFKNADRLQKGDLVLVPKRKDLINNIYSEDFLYLMGWYIADGYISPNNRINICFGINELHIAQKIKTIIESLDTETYSITEEYIRKDGIKVKGFIANRIKADCTIKKVPNKECYVLSKKSDYICEILKRECGPANNKLISSTLFNSNNLLPLVLGYLEGDGHQKKRANYDGSNRVVIECSTIYEELGKQIRQILIDNNIWSTIRFVPIRGKGKNQYCIQINSHEGINKIAEKSLKFFTVVNELKYIKRVAIEKEEGFWVPIKNIETYAYHGDVYNLEVKEDHTYIAGNIVVHNCISLMLSILFKIQMTKVTIDEKKKQVKDNFLARKVFTNRHSNNYM